jgi:hypothetical protein
MEDRPMPPTKPASVPVWNPTERVTLAAKETKLSTDWVAVVDGTIADGLVRALFTAGNYLLAQLVVDGTEGDFFRINDGLNDIPGALNVKRGQRIQIRFTSIETADAQIGVGFMFA